MADPNPITPPPELVQQWDNEAATADMPDQIYIATQAANWGADQELEACCEFMQHEDFHGFAKELRAARRPKPTSLKQQALDVLEHARKGWTPVPDDWDIIRRALETVDDCPSPHRP